MTVSEAERIRRKYYNITNPTEEDTFVFTEALKFLIEKTKDSDKMVELGAHYYGAKEFDLALKYYDLAAEYNNLYAISDLGYIWYYGRTGEKNYEKAFYYFDKARRMGDIIAEYKVADMYKNGYYVEKDYEKYKSMIEDLYKKVRKSYDGPIPEIYTRLAKIRSEEGKIEEALKLYDIARVNLSRRIQQNPFFGNLTIMKWLITDVYKLRQFDPKNVGLYELYYILSVPAKVSFTFEDDRHEVESVIEDGALVIRFDDQWYRTVDDFFAKAELDGELITTRYEELYGFEVSGGPDQKQ